MEAVGQVESSAYLSWTTQSDDPARRASAEGLRAAIATVTEGRVPRHRVGQCPRRRSDQAHRRSPRGPKDPPAPHQDRRCPSPLRFSRQILVLDPGENTSRGHRRAARRRSQERCCSSRSSVSSQRQVRREPSDPPWSVGGARPRAEQARPPGQRGASQRRGSARVLVVPLAIRRHKGYRVSPSRR